MCYAVYSHWQDHTRCTGLVTTRCFLQQTWFQVVDLEFEHNCVLACHPWPFKFKLIKVLDLRSNKCVCDLRIYQQYSCTILHTLPWTTSSPSPAATTPPLAVGSSNNNDYPSCTNTVTSTNEHMSSKRWCASSLSFNGLVKVEKVNALAWHLELKR